MKECAIVWGTEVQSPFGSNKAIPYCRTHRCDQIMEVRSAIRCLGGHLEQLYELLEPAKKD